MTVGERGSSSEENQPTAHCQRGVLGGRTASLDELPASLDGTSVMRSQRPPAGASQTARIGHAQQSSGWRALVVCASPGRLGQRQRARRFGLRARRRRRLGCHQGIFLLVCRSSRPVAKNVMSGGDLCESSIRLLGAGCIPSLPFPSIPVWKRPRVLFPGFVRDAEKPWMDGAMRERGGNGKREARGHMM